MAPLVKNRQYYKFCSYGFLKNLRFFDAFFVLFLLENGLSFTQIGILYAVREIVINISEIPSGIIADTYGRKKSLIISFLIYIISFFIYFLSHGFWLFLLAFTLYGMADAFRTGTHKGMIMDYLKLNHWEEQNIDYYGHTRSWSQIGSALSSLIAGLIVFHSGSYQYIFLFSIIPYLLNLLLIISYPNELNLGIAQKESSGRPGIRLTVLSFIRIIRKPGVLRIINSSAVHSAFLRAVKDYIQPVMVNVALIIPIMIHLDAEKKNGLIIGVIYFLIFLSTSWASKSAARFAGRNKQKISYISLLLGLLMGIICGVFYNYGVWIVSLIAFIGIYVVENIRKPVLTGLIADEVPGEILASVISAQSVIRTAITAILAFVFGIVADRFGIGVSLGAISVLVMATTIFINVLSQKHDMARTIT